MIHFHDTELTHVEALQLASAVDEQFPRLRHVGNALRLSVALDAIGEHTGELMASDHDRDQRPEN